MYRNRRQSSGLVRWLAGFVIVALVVAGFFIYQHFQQPGAVSLSVVPTHTAIPVALNATAQATAAPIAFRVIAATAKLSAPIMELYYATNADTWDLSKLGASAGHLEGTRQLGQGGNFVLAGHVELKDGSAGPFAEIKGLKQGDRVIMFGQSLPNPTVKTYIVTDVSKVPPTDFGAIQNHGYEELTLITCDDYNAQANTYTTRIVVHARPAETVANSGPTLLLTPHKS